MTLMKLTHDSYLPVPPDTTKEEYDEDTAYELILVGKPIYMGHSYRYPWLLHIRQSLHYINLECIKRVKVFHQ